MKYRHQKREESYKTVNDRTMYKSLILIMIKQFRRYPVFLEIFICTALYLLSRVEFYGAFMLCAAGFYIAVISKKQSINFLRILFVFMGLRSVNPPYILGHIALLLIVTLLSERNKYKLCAVGGVINFVVESSYIIYTGRYGEFISLFFECMVLFLIGIIFTEMYRLLKAGEINTDSKTGLIVFFVLSYLGTAGLGIGDYISIERLFAAWGIMLGAYAGGYTVLILGVSAAIFSYNGVYSFISTAGIYSFSSLCCALGSRFKRHGVVLGFLLSNVIINIYSGGVGSECFSFFECLVAVAMFYLSFLFLSYRIKAVAGLMENISTELSAVRDRFTKQLYERLSRYNRRKGLVLGTDMSRNLGGIQRGERSFLNGGIKFNRAEKAEAEEKYVSGESSASLTDKRSSLSFNADYAEREVAFSSVVQSQTGKRAYSLYREKTNKIKFYTHKEKEIYSKLKSMGIRVSSVTVIKNQNEHFVSEVSLFACPGAEFCGKILDTVSATLGIKMSITDGACHRDEEDKDAGSVGIVSRFPFLRGCGEIISRYGMKLGRGRDGCVNSLGERGRRTRCIIKMVQSKKINIMSSVAFCPKHGESISGDSFIYLPVANDKFLVALSDGMGSGAEAYRHSHAAIEMLEQFLSAGLDKHNAIKMINSVLLLNKSGETFATIDVFILDLFSGMAEFLKIGAASSYIKSRDGVFEVSSCSLPAGILGEVDIETMTIKDMTDSYIVMLSDGVEQIDDPWVAEFLREQKNTSPKILADQIMKKAKERNAGNDDITVIASYIS